jgi:RNA polymerase sigma-70 factor (ECF subfamily)
LSRTLTIYPASVELPLTQYKSRAHRQFTATTQPATLTRVTFSCDDGDLMLRYRHGDLRAFEALYERHRGSLYRYVLRQCRDSETAADLFQEVWGRVISNRDRYEVRARFTTYLFHIAHNCCVDYFRRQSARRAGLTDTVDDWGDQLVSPMHERPDAQLARAQLERAFRASLAELPQDQREVFLLYEETGLDLEEIAYVTGVGMETAKSRLRYALNKLRAALKDDPAVELRESLRE